jgi:predicted transcriptional regulator
MNVGKAVRQARRRVGLSQRELAERTGLPQSTVARIESGLVDPRTSTVVKLLAACGEQLEALPRIGEGIDRTLITSLLALSPEDRMRQGETSANSLKRFMADVRRGT